MADKEDAHNRDGVTRAQRWLAANREKGRKATREWRARNPDKLREASAKRWAAMDDTAKADARLKAKLYRQDEKIRERARAKSAAWILVPGNRQKKAEYTRQHSEENPGKVVAKVAAWKLLNPEMVMANHHRRRAREIGASGSHNAADLAFLVVVQKGKCAHSWCRVVLDKKTGRHVDHIMPLSRGGSDDRRNLQLLCKQCNLKKHAKHPIDFARQNGMLI